MTVLTTREETRAINWSGWAQRLGALIGLAFVFTLFALLRPRTFLSVDNLEQIIIETAVVGTAALGMTLIIISGGIDLSVGSNIAICTVIVAVLLKHGVPPAAGRGGRHRRQRLLGAGYRSAGHGTRSRSFHRHARFVGGHPWDCQGVREKFHRGRSGHLAQLPPDDPRPRPALDAAAARRLGMVVLALAVAGLMRYTKFGRHVFAVGSNQQTARLCGVNVGLTKIGVYVLAGALVGVAGVLQFSFLTLGDPTTADGMELDIIAAVVIGGASLNGGEGTVVGTIVGALLMKVVNNGCATLHIPNWVQQIVTGAIIIVAAALDRLVHRRKT